MLTAGTFTGFIERVVKAKRIVDFSFWTKRICGGIITMVGTWFLWQAF